MKLLICSFVLASASMVSAAPPPAQMLPATQAAPPIERQQLARQYIALAVSTESYLDVLRAGIAAGLSQRLGDNLVANDKDEADGAMRRFLVLYEPKVRERLPNLREAYSQIYAREFSADELQQMIAFARSPAGHHYLSRETLLDIDPAVLIQQQGFQNDAIPIFEQIYKEQCAAKAAKRVAMGDKNAKCPLSGAVQALKG